ncbi:uncharacterized protein SPSK_03795 [Sporothrix schenckii 1099-18]|uniref:Uncharacterized protein n=1 Tax=Sporothrix schenckii 1099-18 TaxID=1397361 RepID=A0A0F2LXA9_SPOSC|nr:uncharacterized protein SPSK_03795 [Sporothrix schenckii 1099-18]KJR82098.1 hypothetical protein SPSK_03795 [Sporothrix schenckii 1099-18]
MSKRRKFEKHKAPESESGTGRNTRLRVRVPVQCLNGGYWAEVEYAAVMRVEEVAASVEDEEEKKEWNEPKERQANWTL